MALVEVDGVGGVAVAEPGERIDLPLLLLSAVVGEVDRGEPSGEVPEQPARVDLGQLPRVPDQHHLDVLLVGVGEESCELAGADHPRLVHHQDRSGAEW